MKQLVERWFVAWESGDYYNLPITDNFKHTSPYGTIDGKDNYIALVAANKDKFLGYRFQIHDTIYSENKASVQYTAIQGDFKLDVSEWYYPKEGLIEKIVAYYNIEGEISEDRKLSMLE
ncbi:MAG: nuclear transport factor 2 family protein [Bacteroidia bacterium]|nr:nuclear transport factor 2 family protein [Bacteroidia bacterium]